MLIIFLIIFLFFIGIELYYQNEFIKKMKKDFPKNINADLDETIELPLIKRTNKTPKTLYRTYYDLNLVKKFKNAHSLTLKKNKDLKEIIFDDQMVENYIKDNYSQRIYNAYNMINKDYGACKADFFRYLVIYKEGGIYLDIKSMLQQNIDKEINENKLIISKGRYDPYPFKYGLLKQYQNAYNWSYFTDVSNGEYNNWHFISPAGNKILGKVIQQMISNIEYGYKNKNIYKQGEYSVLAMTGPIMFSKTINKYKYLDQIKIENTNLNNKVRYCDRNLNHRKIGYKKHYSKIKNKNILSI